MKERKRKQLFIFSLRGAHPLTVLDHLCWLHLFWAIFYFFDVSFLMKNVHPAPSGLHTITFPQSSCNGLLSQSILQRHFTVLRKYDGRWQSADRCLRLILIKVRPWGDETGVMSHARCSRCRSAVHYLLVVLMCGVSGPHAPSLMCFASQSCWLEASCSRDGLQLLWWTRLLFHLHWLGPVAVTVYWQQTL